MKKLLQILLVGSAIGLISVAATAGERENETINKVIEAYGGKKLTNLAGIEIYSDLRYSWLGQGHTHEYRELNPMRKIHKFEMNKRWASEEAWGGGGDYAENVIYRKGQPQTAINYTRKNFTTRDDANFYSHFGAEIRTIDTLLAYELQKDSSKAVYKKRDLYLGRPHDVIEFDMDGTSLEPVLWVDSQTGLITKMRRAVPNGSVYSYTFDDHRKSGGLSYAKEFSLYADQVLIEYAMDRTVKPKRYRAKDFAIDKGLVAAPERMDTSELSIDSVAGTTFMVGQDAAYSAFIEMPDHYIAIGGYGGLKDRYEAIAKENKKPLKHLIVTHHHSDHLSGVGDALKLGATIAAPKSAIPNIKSENTDVPESKLMILSGEKTKIGPVDIYMISVPHVNEYALTYIPAAKTIYQEDLYNGNFKTVANSVGKNGIALKKEIERLGIDVNYILSAHGRKAERWTDFMKAAAQYVPGLCPTKRKICIDL